MPSFSSTIKKELFSIRSVALVLFFSFLYVFLSVLLPNYRLVIQTLTNDGSFLFKLTLMNSLILGSWTGLSHVDFFLLILSALLVSVNLLLMGKTIYYLKHSKKIRFSIGGATVVSIVTTGCASCGLSVFSVLGLSTTFAILPFHGMELHILAITFLLFSLWYMLKQLHNAKYCIIKT